MKQRTAFFPEAFQIPQQQPTFMVEVFLEVGFSPILCQKENFLGKLMTPLFIGAKIKILLVKKISQQSFFLSLYF